MINLCPFCKSDLKEKECCIERKNRSNMIDSSIFIEAFSESEYSEDCKLILDGSKINLYLGNVSTIILGEIMKKMLKIKKEANYRYGSIHDEIMSYLLNFKILYICNGTIDKNSELNIRGNNQSQDKINLACAIENNLSMFIVKDSKFTADKKIRPTKIVQITDKKNEYLKNLLQEISNKIKHS